MPKKTIKQLTELTELTSDDLLAVWDDSASATKKIPAQELLWTGGELRRRPRLEVDFPAADYSWVNQDGSTLTDVAGGILFDNHSGTGGECLSAWLTEMPAPPFTVEYGAIIRLTGNHSSFGLTLSEDAVLKIANVHGIMSGRVFDITVRYMDNVSQYSGDGSMDQSYPFAYDEFFVKYHDDGVNFQIYHSPDLENWFLIYDVPKTGPFSGWAPTLYGIGGWKLNSMPINALLTHWKVILDSWNTSIQLKLWLETDFGVYSDVAGTTPAAISDDVKAWKNRVTDVLYTNSSTYPTLASDGIQFPVSSTGLAAVDNDGVIFDNDFTLYAVMTVANPQSSGLSMTILADVLGGGASFGTVYSDNCMYWETESGFLATGAGDIPSGKVIYRLRRSGSSWYITWTGLGYEGANTLTGVLRGGVVGGRILASQFNGNSGNKIEALLVFDFNTVGTRHDDDILEYLSDKYSVAIPIT